MSVGMQNPKDMGCHGFVSMAERKSEFDSRQNEDYLHNTQNKKPQKE